MARRGESTPLGIGEAQTTPTQVLSEDAVLFPQIGNHLQLVAIHPRRQPGPDYSGRPEPTINATTEGTPCPSHGT